MTIQKQELLYITSDKMMIESLLMLGHNAQSIERGAAGELIYLFDKADTEYHVNQILTGHSDEIKVSLADFRRAQDTWTMNLRNIK